MFKERIRFGGKGKMPLEKELRDGSRWNSNQGLELGADVLWYFFVRVRIESMCEFGGGMRMCVCVGGLGD